MLSGNSNLDIGKTAGYNNKVLISNLNMKIGSSRKYYQTRIYHQKSSQSQSAVTQLEAYAATGVRLVKSSDKSIKYAESILPIGNQTMLAEKQNNEKLAIVLLIVETELIAYHFW